jgi:hypothetical protein
MPRARIAPGTVGPVAVVPLGYDASFDDRAEVTIPRPSTDAGDALNYPKGIKVEQPVKVETANGIREYVVTRWRGLARAVDLDGTTCMVRRWAPTRQQRRQRQKKPA